MVEEKAGSSQINLEAWDKSSVLEILPENKFDDDGSAKSTEDAPRGTPVLEPEESKNPSTEIDFENPQASVKQEPAQPQQNMVAPKWQNVQIPQGYKKVAIVGCADSRDQAPYDDPSFEIWGVNNLFLQLDVAPFANRMRWFEPHTFTFDGLFFRRRGKKDFRGTPVIQYMTGLAQLGCPVYMQQPWPQIPNAVEFPLDKAIAKFGRYFTNTIAYELAYAIMLDFDEIHIYGVDMAVAEEFMNQRPSVEFFVGVAVGLGKKVYIPPEADLLKTRFLYGYEEPFADQFNAKINKTISQMNVRHNKAMQEMEAQKLKAAEYRGAIGFGKEYQKIWGEVGENAGIIPKSQYDIKFNFGAPEPEPILADIQSDKEVKPKE